MLGPTSNTARERIKSTLVALLQIGIWLIVLLPARVSDADFCRWLEEFCVDVRKAGISEEVLQSAFANIKEPLPRVIQLDRCQPETLRTSAEYVSAIVTAGRIKQGKVMLRRYTTWLGIIEREYAVQRRFLVALSGIETNYGRSTGKFPVIGSLATLAYEGRRGSYFRHELMQALRILDDKYVSLARMRGSWSGAMGQCQFMPSTFLKHAVDADGDGRTDLWESVPDALASAANYLAAEGWCSNQTWGHQVDLPADFNLDYAGMDKRLPLTIWQSLGVRPGNENSLLQRDVDASLVLPDGPGGRAYLVYDNFRVLMRWNRSVSFAVAVGTLADRISAL